MKEMMDIVDEKDNIVGKETMDEVHDKGLLHRAVHTFIINPEGKLFCRQRSFKKKRYSGFWSTSVGVHVLAGQSYDEVAKESLKNMLGIDCKLTFIGKARVHDKFENEISATYIGYSDEEMDFNPEQIEGGKFFSIKEIRELAKQKNVTPHLAHSLDVYLEYRK